MRYDWVLKLHIGFAPFYRKEDQERAERELKKIKRYSLGKDVWSVFRLKGLTPSELRVTLNNLLINPQESRGLHGCTKDDRLVGAQSISPPLPEGEVWRPVGNLHLSSPWGWQAIEYVPNGGGERREFSFMVGETPITCLMGFSVKVVRNYSETAEVPS